MIGETIDRYRVVEKLGEGGMGVVYKARDTRLDRFVAIKVLPPEVADPERRRRFVDRRRRPPPPSATRHRRQSTTSVRGRTVDFIVMELVPGQTLEQRIGQRALPLGRGLGYAVQIADALARPTPPASSTATSSPTNVMVTDDGARQDPRLRPRQARRDPVPGDARRRSAPATTADPERARARSLGTLAYMSPEQAAGSAVDARSDVFSFGVAPLRDAHGASPFPARLVARDALGHPRGRARGADQGGTRPASRGRAGDPALPAQGALATLAEHGRPLGGPARPARGLGVGPSRRRRRARDDEALAPPAVDPGGRARPGRRGGARSLPAVRTPRRPRAPRALAIDLRRGADGRPRDLRRWQADHLRLGPQWRGAPRHLGAARHREGRGAPHPRPARRVAAHALTRRVPGRVSVRARRRGPLRGAHPRGPGEEDRRRRAPPPLLSGRLADRLPARRGLHAAGPAPDFPRPRRRGHPAALPARVRRSGHPWKLRPHLVSGRAPHPLPGCAPEAPG